MMTRILIVEDDPLVLELHRQFVSTMEGFTVAGTATGGSQALEFLENNPVDCLLLDIFMPDFDGLELLKRMRERAVDTDVIIISAANERRSMRPSRCASSHATVCRPAHSSPCWMIFTMALSTHMTGTMAMATKKSALSPRRPATCRLQQTPSSLVRTPRIGTGSAINS